jgi:hypothetical protein
MHQWAAIFSRHQKRFGRRLPFRACCFDFGNFMMYAAASLSVASGLPFGGWIGSSNCRDHANR